VQILFQLNYDFPLIPLPACTISKRQRTNGRRPKVTNLHSGPLGQLYIHSPSALAVIENKAKAPGRETVSGLYFLHVLTKFYWFISMNNQIVYLEANLQSSEANKKFENIESLSCQYHLLGTFYLQLNK